MAKGRALRGARLSLITMIGVGTSAPETVVSELKEHVTEVEYKVDAAAPSWIQ